MLGHRVRPSHARIGVFALSTVLAIALCTDTADARGRRKRNFSSYQPPYAAIVVDANTGQVLHAANPDASRHPASLTKIMTLYLLFEQIEAGKVKLDTPFSVSQHAAAQAPSKLGLKPGQTISAEDAIKALVTKSANDVAVVVAEAIGGDEDDFAKRMTRKARALGMKRTIYTNASGLPDPDQITTARDQSVLGRAIQDRFPRYYRYFSTSAFNFRGVAMRNHNKLLGRVNGIDGIKTGYTRASGFNLVTSLRRGNRHVVAVVLGGASGAQRDARMRSLLDTHIVTASTQRTVTKIAEAPQPAEPKATMQLASASSRPAPLALATAPTPDAAPDRQAAPAPVREVSTAREDAMPTGAIRPVLGSEDPLRPVSVKTISVRIGSIKSPALQSIAVPTLMASAAPSTLEATAEAEPAAATPAHALPRVALADIGSRASHTPTESESQAVAPIAVSAAAAPASPSRPTRAAPKGGWAIQVGAFPSEGDAKERLKTAQHLAKTLLAKADPHTERVQKGAQELYRARFVGLDQGTAETACKYFKRNDIACMALKN